MNYNANLNLIIILLRAAVSIAANIAEGFRKSSNADKIRFYNIARGSLEECRYYLILIKDLEYSDTSEEKLLLQEVSKLLEAYSKGISILNPESCLQLRCVM